MVHYTARNLFALLLIVTCCAGCDDEGGAVNDASAGDVGDVRDGQDLPVPDGADTVGTGDGEEGDTGDGTDAVIYPAGGCWAEDEPLADNVIFVSPDGDDGNPGTEAAPLATLEAARDAARAWSAGGGSGGLDVVLRAGRYTRLATLALDAQDSGRSDAPIRWRSYPGEKAIISGGLDLSPSIFSPLDSSDPAYDRVPRAARDQILAADLTAVGVTDLGTLTRRGAWRGTGQAALELIVDGVPLDLARWPNRGHSDTLDTSAPATVRGDIFGAGVDFSPIGTTAAGNADDGYQNYQGDVAGAAWFLYHCTWEFGGATHRYWFLSGSDPRTSPDCWPSGQTAWAGAGTDPIPVLTTRWGAAVADVVVSDRPEDFSQDGFLRIPEVFSDTSFRIPGTRAQSWTGEDDVWVQGLFGNYWADDSLGGQIDGAGVITLDAQPHYGVKVKQPFYVFNVLSELDQRGEYYVDRTTGRIYLWPQMALEQSTIVVTTLDDPLVQLRQVSHLHVVDLTFEGGRGIQVDAQGVQDFVVRRSELIAAGGDAVRISGSDSGVACSRIMHPGGQGIELRGGHRADLTPSGDFVRDTEALNFGRWDRTYHPAVRLAGCGHVVEHNLLHLAPHSAILFTGNEHRIEHNEIAEVVLESNDAGAIYVGRDWGYRGNLIRHNWIHDVWSVFGGSHGVYLDDAASGMTVTGNILQNINGLATMSGGGRDNIFTYNIMVHIARGAHGTDRRANESNNTYAGSRPDSWNLLGRLQLIYEAYEQDTPLDHQAEPWASRYPALAAVPDDWASISGTHWLDPEGCVFSRNLTWDCETTMVVGTWGGPDAPVYYHEVDGNLVDVDPQFLDEFGDDLNLRPGSPMWAVPGFEAIPFDEIGPR